MNEFVMTAMDSIKLVLGNFKKQFMIEQFAMLSTLDKDIHLVKASKKQLLVSGKKKIEK